jgi:hypothetical protein
MVRWWRLLMTAFRMIDGEWRPVVNGEVLLRLRMGEEG